MRTSQVRVLAWSELTEPRGIYGKGINQVLADFLNQQPNIVAKTTNINEFNQGITQHILSEIDVLIWFGHEKHAEITEKTAELIMSRVIRFGMGFIALHSSHLSKPFQMLVDANATWENYIENFGPEKIIVNNPNHPIATNIKDFTILQSEKYETPFDVPEPNDVVFKGEWQDGDNSPEVMTWEIGKGKVIYIRAGHETYPIYHMPEMQKIILNSVKWAAKHKENI